MHTTHKGNIRPPLPPNGTRSFKMEVKQNFTDSLFSGDDEGRQMDVETRTEMLKALGMLARRDVVILESQIQFDRADEGGKATIHNLPDEPAGTSHKRRSK